MVCGVSGRGRYEGGNGTKFRSTRGADCEISGHAGGEGRGESWRRSCPAKGGVRAISACVMKDHTVRRLGAGKIAKIVVCRFDSLGRAASRLTPLLKKLDAQHGPDVAPGRRGPDDSRGVARRATACSRIALGGSDC